MPYLKIVTNQEITGNTSLLHRASQLVAEQLGKPERYVMVESQENRNMLFAGSSEPLAYLELKSIGLPTATIADLSDALATLMKEELGVSKDRIYIEFSDAPRNMWGWNGGTF